MSFDPHTNFAYSLVTVAPSPAGSGTTLTVGLGEGAIFPAAPFNCTVWVTGAQPLVSNAEIVRVTAKVGDVFTIVRAQEGSSARVIVVGDQIAATITVKTLTDVEAAIPSTAGLLSAVNVSAGVTSNNLSALTFSNSNGVSFGLTGSVITGSVATNYQSQGAYLTTAALSQDSSNYQSAGAYLTTAGLSGDSSKYAGTAGAITGGSITVNTAGVSVNLPAYLTTAMQSNAATLSNVKVSAGASSANLSALTFSNSNGLSFGLSAGTLTGSYTVPTVTAGSDTIGISNLGNTAGTSGVISGDAIRFLFAGGNNITLSQSIVGASATVTISGPNVAGAQTALSGLSAGTTQATSGTILFSDANGVSFGVDGNTLTATVRTNYQSAGAYLTTAMQSNAVTLSNAKVSAGTLSALRSDLTFGDSNGVSFGLETNGILTGTVRTDYQSAGAYLTTAMLSNAATISNIKVSAGTLSALRSAITYGDSNGVSFGLETNGIITATVATNYQSAGAYLTTAALSADSSKYAGTGFTSGGTNISISGTHNTAGLSLSLSVADAAGQSNQTVGLYASSNTNLTSSGTVDARSLTFRAVGPLSIGYSAGEMVFSNVGQSAGAYLTTAALSQDSSKYAGTGFTSAGANVGLSGTHNTAGLSLSVTVAAQSNQTAGLYASSNTNLTSSGTVDVRSLSFRAVGPLSIGYSAGELVFSNVAQTAGAYLTTAALSQDSSKYAGTNGAITGGSITVNTAGVSVNLPAYLTTADLSANSSKYVQEWALTGNTAGTTSSAQGTRLYFSGGNSITISGSSNSLVFSVGNYLTTAALSADSSKYAGTGFTTTTQAGAVIAGTHDTAGLKLGVPAYLTTSVAQTNQTVGLYASSNTNLTSSGTVDARSLTFRAVGPLSIGYSGGELIFSNVGQSAGAYLTTAALSQDSSKYAGTAGAITGGSITVNTAGVSVNLPAYLTTAALSGDTTKYVQEWALTGNTAGTTSSAQGTRLYFSGGNSITISGSSNSLVFSVGNYLTTAALSADSSKYAGTGFTSAGANIGISGTHNTAGLSLSATVAAQSNQSAIKAFGVSNTGQTAGNTGVSTGVDWVLAGSQSITLSQSTAAGGPNTVWFQHPAWLTTAALSADSSKYAGTNAAITGGSITVNTAGVSVNIAAGVNFSAGTTSSGLGSVVFSNSNGVSFGLSGSTITGTVNTYSTVAVTTVGSATTVYSVASANSVGTVTRWAAEDHRHAGIGAIGISTSGNTAGTTGSVLGTYWMQGGNNLTVSQITSNNGSHTLVLSAASQTNQTIGAYVLGNTTGQSSSSTFDARTLSISGVGNVSVGYSGSNLIISGASAEPSPVNFSAGTTSSNIGSVVFADSNGISFGLNGSTITGTVKTDYLTTAALSADSSKYAGTNAAITGGSITVNTAGVSVNVAAMNFSAGSTSSGLGSVVFSNSNGISFGLNGSTITAQDAFISQYTNMAMMGVAQGTWNGVSISHAVAFHLPQPISASFLRIPIALTTNSTTLSTLGSSANMSVERYWTFNAVVYSNGVGGSSRSLMSVASGSAGWTFRNSLSLGADGTSGSYTQGMSYQVEGGQTNTSTQYSVANTNYSFSTGGFHSLFTGSRFLDINFANSLSAGPYWLVAGYTSSSASNSARISAASNCHVAYVSHYEVGEINSNFGILGSTNLSSGGLLGGGSFSTAGGGTTSAFPISALSSSAANPLLYFQLIRSA